MQPRTYDLQLTLKKFHRSRPLLKLSVEDNSRAHKRSPKDATSSYRMTKHSRVENFYPFFPEGRRWGSKGKAKNNWNIDYMWKKTITYINCKDDAQTLSGTQKPFLSVGKKNGWRCRLGSLPPVPDLSLFENIFPKVVGPKLSQCEVRVRRKSSIWPREAAAECRSLRMTLGGEKKKILTWFFPQPHLRPEGISHSL